MARAGLPAPPNLAYAPVDFDTDRLDERLSDAGVDLRAPAFFSWLGVTPFLEEAAIDDVLRVIAGSAPGSEVVFTFAPLGDTPSAAAAMAAAVGECFDLTSRRHSSTPSCAAWDSPRCSSSRQMKRPRGILRTAQG